MKCPLCGKEFVPVPDSPVLPFCCLRCKMIDAKRWLNEEYSVNTINREKLEEELAKYEEAIANNPELN